MSDETFAEILQEARQDYENARDDIELAQKLDPPAVEDPLPHAPTAMDIPPCPTEDEPEDEPVVFVNDEPEWLHNMANQIENYEIATCLLKLEDRIRPILVDAADKLRDIAKPV